MQTIMTTAATKPDSSEFAFDTTIQPEFALRVAEVTGLAMDVMGLPFDVARAQYARAVQVGLIERSMLASRDFSRTVGALEQLALGPWARHV